MTVIDEDERPLDARTRRPMLSLAMDLETLLVS